MLLSEALSNNIQGTLSLFQVGSRLEPGHESEGALGALRPGILDLFFVFGSDVDAERKVEIRIDDEIGAVKTLRGYTNDGQRMTIHFH